MEGKTKKPLKVLTLDTKKLVEVPSYVKIENEFTITSEGIQLEDPNGVLPTEPFVPISKKNLVIGELVGSGGQGTIFRCDYDNKNLVVKKFKIITCGSTENNGNIKPIGNEVSTYLKIHKLKATGFVDFYNAFYDIETSTVNLVLEYMKDGSLANKKFGEEELVVIVRQLLLQINFLHTTLECAHNDLKPSNILKSGNKISIADFGCTSSSYTRGTPKYEGPERHLEINLCKDNFACDIWALGITALELALGEYPFKKHENEISFFS